MMMRCCKIKLEPTTLERWIYRSSTEDTFAQTLRGEHLMPKLSVGGRQVMVSRLDLMNQKIQGYGTL
jgi:hypothetical protein